MRAAGLHAIGTVLEPEAVQIQPTTPKHPNLSPLIDRICAYTSPLFSFFIYKTLGYWHLNNLNTYSSLFR
jgi:hypothetical protein